MPSGIVMFIYIYIYSYGIGDPLVGDDSPGQRYSNLCKHPVNCGLKTSQAQRVSQKHHGTQQFGHGIYLVLIFSLIGVE